MFFQNKEYSLSSCNLFKKMTDAEIKLLFDNLHYQIKTFEKEQYIAYRNNKCVDLLILLSGKVSAVISNFDEKKIKVAEIDAINNLASAFLFGEKKLFPVNIIAKTEVIVLKIPTESVLKMFSKSSKFTLNFLDEVSNRAQYLMEKLKFLSFQTLEKKLAFYLLKKSNEQKSDVVKIKQTQQELSELFGVARESLSRSIKQFVDNNYIKTEKKKLILLDKKAIKALL